MSRTILNKESIKSGSGTLRAAGLKLTPQRLAIVRCLTGDETHPTAQAIFTRLQGTFPTISFATVYNTLGALAAMQQLNTVCVRGPTRFDPNTVPHDHAICDRCGSIRDIVPETEGRQGRGPLSAMTDFHVDRVERIYRGLCRQCARKNKNPKR